MTLVINFFFSMMSDLWDLITDYWILSVFVLITVLGFIVDLIKKSREK